MKTLPPNWPDEIVNILKGLQRSFEREQTFYATPPQNHFKKLIMVTNSIDTTFDPRPKICPETYVRDYNEFIAGRQTALNVFTVRQLCWNRDIATDLRFLKHIKTMEINLNARALRGLLYSLHLKWSHRNTLQEEIGIISSYILRYMGINKGIKTWKANISDILSKDAHKNIVKDLVEKKMKVNDYFKELTFYCGTEFYIESIKYAIVTLIERLGNSHANSSSSRFPKQEKLNYLINEILSLQGLPLELLKQGVSQLILNSGVQREKDLIESVKEFILNNNDLGDPRIPRNSVKWAGVDEKAKNRFIEYLSSEDIVFFFQHVLRDSTDLQGRKNFWLQYVKSLTKSRCWLTRDASINLRSRIKSSQATNYGNLHTGLNSVFVLDFGRLFCVEFSQVGAIYVYENNNIPRPLKNFWSTEPLTESEFKNTHLLVSNEHRITHAGYWQLRIQNLLARYGIRPS